MRDSAIIYRSFYESMDGLTKDQQADVWKAICEFSFNQKEIELTGVSKSIFTLIRPQLAANHKRYENGKKPKSKQNVSEPEANQKHEESKTEAKTDQIESEPEANKNKNENSNLNGNVKEKTKPSSDKSDGLTNPFLESYNVFLKKRTGTTEQFSVAGRAGLKKIITYLKSQVENKHKGAAPEFITEETLKAWQWVLNHFEKWDKFHQGQLKIEQINSNLVNIISSIRNAKQSKSGTKHGTDYNRVAAEAISIVAANYGLNGTPNQHTTQGEPPSNSSEGDFSDFEVMQ